MERFAWPEYLSSSRKHAIQELLHGQNPTKKLRHLFDAHSQTGNDTGQPLFAEDLIVNALRSFCNTLSLSSSSESYEVLQVPTNACVRSEVSEGSETSGATAMTDNSNNNNQSTSSDYYAVFESAGEILALLSDQGDVMLRSRNFAMTVGCEFDSLLDDELQC